MCCSYRIRELTESEKAVKVKVCGNKFREG